MYEHFICFKLLFRCTLFCFFFRLKLGPDKKILKNGREKVVTDFESLNKHKDIEEDESIQQLIDLPMKKKRHLLIVNLRNVLSLFFITYYAIFLLLLKDKSVVEKMIVYFVCIYYLC